MAWRIVNGNRYYYKSVREGSRVRTEYYGGELGQLADAMSREDQRERLSKRLKERKRRERWDRIDKALDEIATEARRLAEGVLTESGFHRHNRGEWRKRRAESN